MSALPIPTYLAREAARRGEDGAAWLRDLPGLVGGLATKWSLSVDQPFEPGGGEAWTAPVLQMPDGEPLVLKVGWLDFESLQEADGLRAWGGAGAIHLRGHWSDDTTQALLLERCDPGSELRRSVAEPDQDMVVVKVLHRLWIQPPETMRFRPLSEMCEVWASEHAQRRVTPSSDPGLVREGFAAWLELPKTAEQRVLLATDLHGGNILAARREPWLAIDPKPFVGDPTYDLLQHMTNCPSRLASKPVDFCLRMAELAGVDASRLQRWLFARLIVDADWPFGSDGQLSNQDVARKLAL